MNEETWTTCWPCDKIQDGGRIFTRPEGSRGKVSALPLIFLILVILNMQASIACVLGQVTCQSNTRDYCTIRFVAASGIGRYQNRLEVNVFLAFLFLCFAPATYFIQTHRCCESGDRKAESTRKIVVKVGDSAEIANTFAALCTERK